MTPAERRPGQRELADDYADPEATSALDPAMLKALVQGKGDDTRYDKRLNAPAPGGKAHFRTLVRRGGGQLGIALSDEQIDFLIQRKLSRVNFNLYERYTAKPEARGEAEEAEAAASGTRLHHAAAAVRVVPGALRPRRGADRGRGHRGRSGSASSTPCAWKECVDWSTAYTLWRNMLVDYEVRWSEWDPQLHLPPTMWDWEDHTQENYKTMRELAILVSDESSVHPVGHQA